MKREIGSEFIIENFPMTHVDTPLPGWLSKFGNVVLTSSGRGALSLLIDQITPKSKNALIPAYICESVILPFEEAGFEIQYYNVDKNFNVVDFDTIENFHDGVFLHLGYFGQLTNNAILNSIRKLRNKSVYIIEDVTHTLFSDRDLLIENDFVFGSIRKWFGIPSGGFLSSRRKLNVILEETPNDFLNLRIKSFKEKAIYLEIGNEDLKRDYLNGFSEAEDFLDTNIKAYKIDFISEFIIKTTNVEHMKLVRQTNYKFLQEALSFVKGISVQNKVMNSGECPLFLTLLVNKNRDDLREKLIGRDIYCPIHWPLPKQVIKFLSIDTKEVYEQILSIPCDQRYDLNDMQRIVKEIKNSI